MGFDAKQVGKHFDLYLELLEFDRAVDEQAVPHGMLHTREDRPREGTPIRAGVMNRIYMYVQETTHRRQSMAEEERDPASPR